MHFAEYALLAALLYRAFRADSPVRWRLLWACYTFALLVSWALLDEFHQAQTHKRGGSIYDSMIDSAGGLTMLLLIALASRRRAPVKDQASTVNNKSGRAS
jgi:VanZ family protein